MSEENFRVWAAQGVGLPVCVDGVPVKFDVTGRKVCVCRQDMQSREHVIACFAHDDDRSDFVALTGCTFRLPRSAVMSETQFRAVMAVAQALKSASERNCWVRVRVRQEHNCLGGCVGVVQGWNLDRNRVNVEVHGVWYPLELRWLVLCEEPPPPPEGGGDL